MSFLRAKARLQKGSSSGLSKSPRLTAIQRKLERLYGRPRNTRTSDALEQLVGTILSQNTSDVNSERSYEALRRAYPTWQAVLDAPRSAVAAAIRMGGLADLKAERIQTALRRVHEETGAFNVDFLATGPVEKARAWMTSIPGVGPKTAAIVLLFALRRPAFPVDTHVHRVTRRLGLIDLKTSRERAHELLEALVSPKDYYPFHLNLIRHGRETCHAQRPECSRCVLLQLCAHPQPRKPERRSAPNA